MSIIKRILTIFKKEEFYVSPNGNKFFYTRNGFGVISTPENRAKRIIRICERQKSKNK